MLTRAIDGADDRRHLIREDAGTMGMLGPPQFGGMPISNIRNTP